MTQQEKFEKCDELIRDMYYLDTGKTPEESSFRYSRWMKKNCDRVCSLVRSVMREEGIDNG